MSLKQSLRAWLAKSGTDRPVLGTHTEARGHGDSKRDNGIRGQSVSDAWGKHSLKGGELWRIKRSVGRIGYIRQPLAAGVITILTPA